MTEKRWALICFLAYCTVIGALAGSYAAVITGLWLLFLLPA